MNKHKFFAWATVACFVLTMYTGYGKFKVKPAKDKE